MRAYVHSTDEVNEKVQRVLAEAKALSGVSDEIQFHHLPEHVVPPRDFPVLSLGAYKRRGLEHCVVTYSPKQIVTKADSLSHLAHAFRVLTKVHDLPEFEYGVFESVEGAQWILDELRDTTLALDIETKGDVDSQVPGWDKIISIGFYDGTQAYVIPEELLSSTTMQGVIRNLIEANTCVLANGKFDLKYLGAQPLVFEDTLLQHYALYPAASAHGLKDTAKELFGADDWDAAMKKQFLKKETVKAYEDRGDGAYAQAMSYTSQNGYERIPRDVLYRYCGADVFWTYHIYQYQREMMESDPDATRLYREHLIPLSNMFQDIEAQGIRFDVDYMIDLADELTKEGEQLLGNLQALAGVPINPNSPKQVKEWFAGQGVQMESTNEASLVEHIRDHEGLTVEFAEMLLAIRKNKKMNGTYITGYLKKLIGDRGYPGYKLHASITGRLGGAGPSMLTIPRDKRIKKMVLPDEGQVVVASDLSQAELRVMAVESADPWMLGAFQPDAGDFFDNLISNTYPEMDVEQYHKENPGDYKDLRARFKGVVYGTSFGRGAKAIGEAVGISQDAAQELIDAYVRPGSEFAEWRKHIEALALGEDVLRNPFGRRYQSELVTSKNRSNIVRSGLSFPSQSTANDICLTAALEVHRRLADEYPEARIMGTVHDCIFVSCPPQDAQAVGSLLSHELREAGRRVYDAVVSFESDAEWGNNIGEMDDDFTALRG